MTDQLILEGTPIDFYPDSGSFTTEQVELALAQLAGLDNEQLLQVAHHYLGSEKLQLLADVGFEAFTINPLPEWHITPRQNLIAGAISWRDINLNVQPQTSKDQGKLWQQ